MDGWELEGVCDSFRLVQYTAGHFYGNHIDRTRGLMSRHGREYQTLYTLMVYLNSPDQEFVGGDLVFHLTEDMRITPASGLGCVFIQEDNELVHESETLEEGCKWILRGDVYYSRPLNSDSDGEQVSEIEMFAQLAQYGQIIDTDSLFS